MESDPITALSCWRGSVTVEPLSGGITNRNYRVLDGDQAYVVRLCEELPHLGIDRRNESLCQSLAHEIGIAPRVVYEEPGVLVSEFVEGATCSAEDLRESDLLRRLAAVVRQYHDAWDRLHGEVVYFSAFQTVETYAVTAATRGVKLPEELDELLADARQLAHRLSPFQPVLCHNDLLAANILDDGATLRIVDWEYAGVGNPLFDLASISSNAALTGDQERTLLEAYRGELVERDRVEVQILKTVSLLREALWSFIQTVSSDLDFDYRKYASDNLQAYREARAAL